MASLLTNSDIRTENHCADQKLTNCRECLTEQLYKEPTVVPESFNFTPADNRCTNHFKTYDWYCLYHGMVCCSVCIKIMHISCQLKPIDEIIHEIKCSCSIRHLEKYLFDIHVQIDQIVKDISGKLSTKNKNKAEFGFRKRNIPLVEAKWDLWCKIDRNRMDKKIKKNYIDRPEIEHILDKALEEREYIHQLQDCFVKPTEHGNDFQTFLMVTKLIPQAVEKANSISKIQRDLILYNAKAHGLAVQKGCLSGCSSVNKEITNGDKSTYGDQILILDKVFLLQNQNCTPEIYGIEIVPDGRIVLLDHLNKMLIIMNRDGKDNRYVKFWSEPFDVCHVDKTFVAVTTNIGSSGEIVLVNIANQEKIKTIQFPNRCFGIDCKDKTMAVRSINRFGFNIEIVLIDTENYMVFRRIMIPEYYIEHISLYNDKILCTDPFENTVLCYNLSGELVWSYKNEKFGPRQITTDRHGTVYVIGDSTKSVLFLSPIGEFRKVFVTEQEELNEIQCIYYNVYQDNIVLYSKHGKIGFYSVGV